jgi:hypothetical protein
MSIKQDEINIRRKKAENGGICGRYLLFEQAYYRFYSLDISE